MYFFVAYSTLVVLLKCVRLLVRQQRIAPGKGALACVASLRAVCVQLAACLQVLAIPHHSWLAVFGIAGAHRQVRSWDASSHAVRTQLQQLPCFCLCPESTLATTRMLKLQWGHSSASLPAWPLTTSCTRCAVAALLLRCCCCCDANLPFAPNPHSTLRVHSLHWLPHRGPGRSSSAIAPRAPTCSKPSTTPSCPPNPLQSSLDTLMLVTLSPACWRARPQCRNACATNKRG